MDISSNLTETAPPEPKLFNRQLLTRRRIMIVTDEPMNRALIEAILRGEPDFDMVMASSPPEMNRTLAGVDLIALDLAVPASELLAVCRQVKGHPHSDQVPLLLLTPHSGGSSIDRSHALAAGADDVLGKPFHRSELILRIRALLRIKCLRDELEEAEQILLALCRLVESKVSYTQAHSERVALYSEMLGREIELASDDLRILRRSALLHDVGKLAIPELVLNKPGALTSEETKQLRQQLILPTAVASSLTNTTPQIIPIIRHHHEHVDGSGYPDHLAGDEIPLGARILAIADAFDAMTSQRPYRPAFSHERAAAQLKAGGGAQWDATLVEAFLHALGLLKESGAWM